MKSEDAQLLEILIAGDDTERTREAREGAGESDSLLATMPDRSAASLSKGQGSLTQGSSKKGILKKGEALRRASAAAETRPASGVPSSWTLCYVPLHRYDPVHEGAIAWLGGPPPGLTMWMRSLSTACDETALLQDRPPHLYCLQPARLWALSACLPGRQFMQGGMKTSSHKGRHLKSAGMRCRRCGLCRGARDPCSCQSTAAGLYMRRHSIK